MNKTIDAELELNLSVLSSVGAKAIEIIRAQRKELSKLLEENEDYEVLLRKLADKNLVRKCDCGGYFLSADDRCPKCREAKDIYDSDREQRRQVELGNK